MKTNDYADRKEDALFAPKREKKEGIEPKERIPGNPFNGFFKENPNWMAEKDSLLDVPPAKRMINLLGWGERNDVYCLQQALEGKSGPYVQVDGQSYAMLSSYDYLGLIGNPEIEEASIEAIRQYGTGTGGVRLLTGTTRLHHELEKEIAEFKGVEAAVTYTSGYMANLAVISGLFNRRDRIIVDEKIHRSTLDACNLAGVPCHCFRHNDPKSLEKVLEEAPPGRRTLIIIEGVYSMDGDIGILPEVVAIKNRYGAFLMVDEAHSFGILGENGRGVDRHFGIPPTEVDIWMGSLSKAIPSNGGFLAGRKDLIIYLQHGSAPYIFSAALCPAASATALASIRMLRRKPEILTRLWENTAFLKNGLKSIGYNIGHSESPVIPLMIGKNEQAYYMTRELFSSGILAVPVVFPAVPVGKARLRLCATAAQSRSMLTEVLQVFQSLSLPYAQHNS